MAQLNKTDLEGKYNHASTGLFKDNTSRAIGADDVRALVEDEADSIPFTLDDSYTWPFPQVTASGTNTYAATLSPVITAYATGQKFQIKFTNASSGVSTLNLNALGAKKIFVNPTTQASNLHIVAGQIYLLNYDTALDAGTGGFLIVGTGTLAAVLAAGNNATGLQIKNLNDGSDPQDAVTKSQLDAAALGIVSSWKAPVVNATTANITLSGEQTIDGILTSASRILVKNQTAQTENGIYVTAAGAWARSTDANIAAELEGVAVMVQQGTVAANTTWIQTTDGITLGVSNIVWSQMGTTVPDADASTKGIAKLYTSTGGNADGAMDQNSTSNAIALRQPIDADLTAIAGLTPSNDDIIQRKAGAWTNRTMAQLAADLTALSSAFVETATVYVDAAGNDSTGILGRADKPFLTITAALAAGVAVTSLRIKIGMGTFDSPSSANLRGNLWLEGSGKPGYNNTYTQTAFAAVTISDPTALLGGTILRGTLYFQDKSNVHLTDFGVDCGSAYVTGGGTEGNQIAFLSATLVANWTLMTNVVIKNITTLGRTAGSLFHAIQCENCFKPLIVNCDTYFSTHGIVLKSYGGMAVNVRCNFHTANAVVYKTDTYAFGWISQLHNFEIQGGGGILIDVGTGTSSGGVNSCKISNGIIRSSTFGFRTNSTVESPAWVHYVDVDNVKVHGSTGVGFDIDDSQSCQVLNCAAIACSTGFVVVAESTYTFCSVMNCHAEACTTGFNISAVSSSAIIRNCSARSNTTGYTIAGVVYASGLTNDSNTTNFSGSTIPINIERGSWFFGSSGVVAPTARVHIVAGTTTAGSGPLKLTEGVNPSTIAGAVEDGLLNYVANNLTFIEQSTVYTLAKTLTNTATLNFDLTAVNYQDLTITVTGAADGDAVVIGVPNGAAVADITFFGWVSAANTVTVRASRVGGGGAADPASGTFRASVVKY